MAWFIFMRHWRTEFVKLILSHIEPCQMNVEEMKKYI